ncbi:hypothetical protein RJZ56_004554 [Blastomyces dermatitidis]
MLNEARSVSADDRSYDNKRNVCSCGTVHEENSEANFVNPEESREGAETVDDSVDACGKEGGLDVVGSPLAKDCRGVVDHGYLGSPL